MSKEINTNKVITESAYKKDLHKKFYLLHMFRRTYTIYFVLLLGIFVVYLAVKNTIASPESTKELIMIWTLTLLTLLVTPLMMLIRIKSSCKLEAKNRGDSIENIEFTKDKILRRINGASKVVLGWNNIDYIYETKEAFFLYVSEDQGLVIDKKSIILGDILLLRKLITNNLKPNKKGKIPYKKTYKGEIND